MLRSIPAVALALALLGAVAAAAPAARAQSQQDPAITEDVKTAYAAWDAAFNKGDAKGIASAYLPNAKLLPPTHEVASGPAEIETFFAGLFANGVTDHRLEMIDAGGDEKIVYGTANWTAKGKDADGKPQSFGGIATHVFERQADGSLKLRLHSFN